MTPNRPDRPLSRSTRVGDGAWGARDRRGRMPGVGRRPASAAGGTRGTRTASDVQGDASGAPVGGWRSGVLRAVATWGCSRGRWRPARRPRQRPGSGRRPLRSRYLLSRRVPSMYRTSSRWAALASSPSSSVVGRPPARSPPSCRQPSRSRRRWFDRVPGAPRPVERRDTQVRRRGLGSGTARRRGPETAHPADPQARRRHLTEPPDSLRDTGRPPTRAWRNWETRRV